MNNNYFVSRQHYYYTGQLTVEIAQSVNTAGSDALSPRWNDLGEFDTFHDPRKAAEAAIKVRDAWQASFTHTDDQTTIHLSTIGRAAGSLGLSGEPITEKELKQWAVTEYTRLDKCHQCGEVIPPNSYFHLQDYEDTQFCSQNCGELYLEEEYRLSKATHIIVDGPQPSQNGDGDEVGRYYVFVCNDDGDPVPTHNEYQFWDHEMALEFADELGNQLELEVINESSPL